MSIDQAEAVRRRIVEGLHRELVDGAAPLGIFRRETIVEGLVLCDGDIDAFNVFYNAWRDGYEVRSGADRDASFLTFLEEMQMKGAKAPRIFTWFHLTESPTSVSYLCAKFAVFGLPKDVAARCLLVGKGDVQRTEDLLARVLPTLDYKYLVESADAEIERLDREGRYGNLNEHWRGGQA